MAEFPDNDDWAQGVSQLYTRIGDIDIAPISRRQSDYGSSMAIAAKYFERKPNDESWQRELAWPYAKLADVSQKKADADKDVELAKHELFHGARRS